MQFVQGWRWGDVLPVHALLLRHPSTMHQTSQVCAPPHPPHSIHLTHQLKLQTLSSGWCSVCKSECTSWWYGCRICSFDIHLEWILAPCETPTTSRSMGAPTTPAPPPYDPYGIAPPRHPWGVYGLLPPYSAHGPQYPYYSSTPHFIIGHHQLLLVLMLMVVPMLHHTIFFCFATFVFWFLCVGRYHSM